MVATRRTARIRLLALGSLGVVVLGASTLGGSAAHGAPTRSAAKVPPGVVKVNIASVVAVPHSSDLFVLGSAGTVGNAHFLLGRRHDGRWQRVKVPNIGGRYGTLDVLAAGSAKTIWLGGGREVGHGDIDEYPTIWRWSGKRFVMSKVPKMNACACAVTSISASSPTNAWAGGDIYTAASGGSNLKWNGRTWLAEPAGGTAIATSGVHNTWAIGGGTGGYDLNQFSDGAWVDKGTTPASVSLFAIATSSSKLVYAVGEASNPITDKSRPVIMRFNGKTWSELHLKGVPNNTQLRAIAMHGKSVWALGTHDGRRTIIIHSTGGGWKVQQLLSQSYSLDSITAVSAKQAYAAGEYYNQNIMAAKSYLESYNGHSWKGVSSQF